MNKKLERKMLSFFYLQNTFKKQSEDFEKKKKEFYADMEKEGIDSYDFLVKNLNINVKRIQRKTIVFNPIKLKTRLKKSLFDYVVTKKIVITDYKGLVEYLKKCGVNPHMFKKFISVEYLVNNDEIQQLHELGEIDADDLNGCYEVITHNPYYKIIGKSMSEQE